MNGSISLVNPKLQDPEGSELKSGVDTELLDEQMATLIMLRDSTPALPDREREHLEGLINLLSVVHFHLTTEED